MEPGSVLAAAAVTGNSGTVDTISFQVSNAAAGEAIDMTAGNTIIKYTDNNQTKNLDTSSLFTATEVGSGDGDSLLERGEVFEVIILDMVGLLDTDLGTDTTFTLEVVPPKGISYPYFRYNTNKSPLRPLTLWTNGATITSVSENWDTAKPPTGKMAGPFSRFR